MTSRRRRTEIAVVLLAVLVALAVPSIMKADVSFALRPALAVLSVFLTPGAPVAVLLGLDSPLGTFCMMIAVSLSALIIASVIFLLWNAWSPIGVELVVSGVTIVTAPLAIRRRTGAAA